MLNDTHLLRMQQTPIKRLRAYLVLLHPKHAQFYEVHPLLHVDPSADMPAQQ